MTRSVRCLVWMSWLQVLIVCLIGLIDYRWRTIADEWLVTIAVHLIFIIGSIVDLLLNIFVNMIVFMSRWIHQVMCVGHVFHVIVVIVTIDSRLIYSNTCEFALKWTAARTRLSKTSIWFRHGYVRLTEYLSVSLILCVALLLNINVKRLVSSGRDQTLNKQQLSTMICLTLTLVFLYFNIHVHKSIDCVLVNENVNRWLSCNEHISHWFIRYWLHRSWTEHGHTSVSFVCLVLS
jgi:hypothetical protein